MTEEPVLPRSDRRGRATRCALAIAAITLHPGCDRAQCRENPGLIHGVVSGYDSQPTVFLYETAGVLLDSIYADSEGVYQFYVDPGSYRLFASGTVDADSGWSGLYTCYSVGVNVVVSTCGEEKEVGLGLTDCR